jgi:hypothetical protein
MHSYRNARAARSNLEIVPGQAELRAVRVVVLIALLVSLIGIVT